MEDWSLLFRIMLTCAIAWVVIRPINGKEDGESATAEKRLGSTKPADGQAHSFRFAELPIPLIMDGKVQDDNLQKIGQTRFWLKNQLQPRGVFDFKEVFFCSINHRGTLFVDKKLPAPK